jgi:hypothetical protein
MAISGPCVMCGATNYELSFGGTSICPSCDCGSTSPDALSRHIADLTRRLADSEATVKWLTKLYEGVHKCLYGDCGDDICNDTGCAIYDAYQALAKENK